MAKKIEVVLQTGEVKIKLVSGLDVGGVKVMELTMREPSVEDQLAADEAGGTQARKELLMMANLCMQAPDDLKKLKLRDYKLVQEAFMAFLD